MNSSNNQIKPQTARLLLGMLLVLLLLILSACQTRYVPVYLGSGDKAWVLKEDACKALLQPPITEELWLTNKDLRDHVWALDQQWVGFGCEAATE
jgi:hypothetical protein